MLARRCPPPRCPPPPLLPPLPLHPSIPPSTTPPLHPTASITQRGRKGDTHTHAQHTEHTEHTETDRERGERDGEGEAEAGGGEAQYSSVLECILRLRQACCAPGVIPSARLDSARQVLATLEAGKQQSEAAPLEKEEAGKLLKKLCSQLEDELVCAICLEDLDEASNRRMLRECMHSFCLACLTRLLQPTDAHSPDASKCPLCRAPFTRRDIVSEKEMKNAVEEKKKEGGEQGGGEGGEGGGSAEAFSSPKIEAMVADVQSASDADATLKSVVFSQFLGCLDAVASALEQQGIVYTRLDGKMKLAERNATLTRFQEAGGPSVMLVSTRVGGVGLSLTAASRVYMMDLWWNSAVDEQAMDRVHRIGQRKAVTVIRYLCADSIEESILQMQERKEWLGKAALQRLRPAEMRRLRLQQLRHIFADPPTPTPHPHPTPTTPPEPTQE